MALPSPVKLLQIHLHNKTLEVFTALPEKRNLTRITLILTISSPLIVSPCTRFLLGLESGVFRATLSVNLGLAASLIAKLFLHSKAEASAPPALLL